MAGNRAADATSAMSLDISHILNDWPHRGGEVVARKIAGDDGRDKIQLRLDLGLLQMETSGRPDGQRPNGCESLLEFHEHRLEQYRQQHGSDEGFDLDEQACQLLREEAIMYYHRYLAEFVLEDFEGVERDTSRNLRAFDFCQRLAAEESDRFLMEQHRPYVLMMRSRARAMSALRDNRPKVAMAAVREGMDGIKGFFRHYQREQDLPQCGEYAILKALAKEIENRLPKDPLQQIRRELAKAIREERYEDAASLRDRLRHLDKPQS